MGYKIEYDRQNIIRMNVKPQKKLSGKRMKAILIGTIVAVSLAVLQANGGILELLFPGEGIRARQAMEQMVEDIQEGESFKDAFAAFCIEIIDYA